MAGRLQMTFPVSHTSDRACFDPNEKDRAVLLYLGYQTGRLRSIPGALVCLELNPDWEDTEEFCRRSTVLIPRENLACFVEKQLVLVAWRNMALGAESTIEIRREFDLCCTVGRHVSDHTKDSWMYCRPLPRRSFASSYSNTRKFSTTMLIGSYFANTHMKTQVLQRVSRYNSATILLLRFVTSHAKEPL